MWSSDHPSMKIILPELLPGTLETCPLRSHFLTLQFLILQYPSSWNSTLPPSLSPNPPVNPNPAIFLAALSAEPEPCKAPAARLTLFPALCVSPTETPSQDSYGCGSLPAASSYENKQCPLPAAGQPQLPATATLCQPGGSLQG